MYGRAVRRGDHLVSGPALLGGENKARASDNIYLTRSPRCGITRMGKPPALLRLAKFDNEFFQKGIPPEPPLAKPPEQMSACRSSSLVREPRTRDLTLV